MTKIISFFLFIGLTGCQFLGTIANGAHKAYTVLADDRSFGDDMRDFRINLEVRDALGKQKNSLALDVEVTVFEGEVLLTGAVPDANLIQHAMRAAWSVDGVKKVYNYIRMNDPLPLDEVTQEAAWAAKIRTELGMTSGISSSNYKLTLENGVVYLMGVRSSDEEYASALAVIKNSIGVDRVICLMRVPKES